ncbi:MAG TPA: hypothetical protein VJ810_23400 [Blastocatellia bacterium]|nr:hypothetical protein [Blastocatellia bacterium]
MSKITIVFDDLCTFFTSKLPHQLMVGLIDNKGTAQSVPPEDVHQPFITIREVGGDIVKQYFGFDQVEGDIFLDLHQGSLPHTLSELTADDGSRHPFNYLVDIERELYKGIPLNVNANVCRARFHFRDGELYTKGKLFQVRFADMDNPEDSTTERVIKSAVNCGLDVTVPDDGQASFHFSNDTEDFEFEKGKDYRVTISNKAKSQSGNHFQYHYGVLQQPPPLKLIPDTFTPVLSESATPQFNNPFCSIGGFGIANYELKTSHFETQ